MPGFLTHYIAGQTVLNSASPKITKRIKKYDRLFNLGTQGPDIFFYYLPGLIRKCSRQLGGEMHKNNLGIFISHMAYIAKKTPSPKCDCIFTYTAGLIMHYVVDVHAHPYVYAKVYKEGAPKIKNSATHRHFETSIDIALLKLLSGEKPANYSQWELINAETEHMATAAKAMSHAIRQVYDRVVPSRHVLQAMRHMISLTRLLRSKKGRRKKWTALLENITVGENIFSSLVHEQDVDKATDYLNRKHTPWQAPWKTAETCTDSFVDRFMAATAEGLTLIDSLYNYVYSDLTMQALSEKLGNRSLQTGADCGQIIW